MTPFARATRSAFAAALRVAGIRGTYVHKGETKITSFVPSNPQADSYSADANVGIDSKRRDLLVPWNGLGEGDEFVEPQRGGRVTLDDGRVFEVSDGATGSAWRWAGDQAFIRIFAREMDT